MLLTRFIFYVPQFSCFSLLVSEKFMCLASYIYVTIYLNCFVLKVHPSSLTIEGTLGNFRLCDMSLGTEHCWGWLCDIRNPGVESLIKVHVISDEQLLLLIFLCYSQIITSSFLFSFFSKFLFQFKFNSYSAEDDDYEGYDYSLHGHLSAVRIVFLYRFVQEVCWALLVII